MWASLAKQWFLIALACCFAIGYLLAKPLNPLMEMSTLRSCLVFVVMWGMGVTLKADTIRNSLLRPIPSLLATVINILIVPLLCLPAMWLLPENLFGGLFVAAIVPCTLASASVWTRKAGGDDSIAMMTTVVTNLACVVVVPVGIALVLSQQTQVDAVAQMKKLALVVVVPLVLAQAMRWWGLAAWADRKKPLISFLAQLGILVMVMFGAIASANHMNNAGDDSTSWVAGVMLLVLAASVHVGALVIGVLVSRFQGEPPENQIAVGIAGSQKTLMVGLQIAMDCGVSVIPMLMYHFSQLVIDTVIASRWKEAHDQTALESTL